MLRDSPTDQEHRQESLRSRIRLIQARQKGERLSAENYAKELGIKGQTGLSNLRVILATLESSSEPPPLLKPRRNGAYGSNPPYRK